MTTPAVQARHAEQQASDAAYTRCVAAEIALRRLHAEQTVDIAQEQQGELSYGKTRVAQSRTARLDAQLDAMTSEQLTTYLTSTQHEAMRAALLQAIPLEGVAPATLAARLRPFVGLTAREVRTVSALRSTLEEEGELTSAQIDGAVARRADQLLDTRATRIARTEMAEAYNEGALQTVRLASEEGAVAYVKVWLTGADERVCPVCGPLHEARAPLNSTFDGGRDRPTAHPGCRCTLLFEEATS